MLSLRSAMEGKQEPKKTSGNMVDRGERQVTEIVTFFYAPRIDQKRAEIPVRAGDFMQGRTESPRYTGWCPLCCMYLLSLIITQYLQ